MLNNVTNNAQNTSPNSVGRGGRAINVVKPSLSHSANRVAAALAKCAAGQVASQNVVPQTKFYGHTPNLQSKFSFVEMKLIMLEPSIH